MARFSRKPVIILGSCCIVILLCGSLWTALRHGVVITGINLPSVTMERFAIRLAGSRFIVAVDRLEVVDPKSSESFASPELLMARFKGLAGLFQKITITRLFFQGRIYHLRYKDELLEVRSDNVRFSGTLSLENGKLLMDIFRLEISPYPITLAGQASYSPETEQLSFTGKFSSPQVSDRLVFTQHNNQVAAEIKTDSFTDLPAILAAFFPGP